MINGPYKSSTVGSVTGANFVSADGVFAADDVGRLIILTDGAGRLQHRKIAQFVNSTTVLVDHAWADTPWLDTVQDVEPAPGDAWVMSYVETDADFVDETGVNASGEQIDIATLVLDAGEYVHVRSSQLDIASAGIEVSTGAGMIFGWYHYTAGRDSQVTESCHIIDRSAGTSGNQWGRGTAAGSSFGMLDIYGGVIQIEGGAPPFWRCYNDNPDKTLCQCRWVDVLCVGNPGLGSRIDGNRSIIITEQVGADTTFGVCNPRESVSRVSISAVGCSQAAYVFLDVDAGGPSGRIVFPRLVDISSRIIRCSTGGHTGANVMEVVGDKSEIDAAQVFVQVEGNPGGSHVFRFGNLVSPRFVNADTTPLTDKVNCVLIDATDATVDARAVEDATFDELFIRHTDVQTVNGPRTLADGTQFAPYSLRLYAFGKQIVSLSVSAEGRFSPSITFIPDSNQNETKSQIQSRTTIATNQQLYDASLAWLDDNYTGQAAPLVSIAGDVGDLDIEFEPSAADLVRLVDGTLVVRSASFVGSVSSRGSVIGKQFVIGPVLDSTQDTTLREINGATFSVYSNPADRSSQSNALATDVTSFATLFAGLVSPDLFISATFGNTVLPFNVTIEQGANEFDSSIAGQLSTSNLLITQVLTVLGQVPEAVENELGDGSHLPTKKPKVLG